MRWFEIKSFLLGLLSASIIWVVYYSNRKHIQEVSKVVKQKNKEAEITDVKGIDKVIRSEMFRDSQHSHLASQIFPLNNIFVEPELMAYPFTNAEDLGDPPIIDQLIPYLPDWPELSGLFNLQGIPMRNLLNAPLKTVLIGPFGSGKSTILAYLAGKFANDEIGQKRFEKFLPLFIHTSEVVLKQKDNRTADEILLASYAMKYPPVLRSKVIQQITNTIRANKFILLYDGMDELSEEEFDQHAAYLAQFAQEHPKIRIITTAAPTFLGKLTASEFYPIVLKGWSKNQRLQLIKKWSSLWSYNLFSDTETNQYSIRQLVENWLISDRTYRNPLEITLRIWSYLSGDTVGESLTSDIEAYFHRLTDEKISHSAIEAIAYSFIQNQANSMPQSTLEMVLIKNKFHLKEKTVSETSTVEIGTKKHTRKTGSSGLAILEKLITVGFLVPSASQELKFKHPIILSYFAGFRPITQEPIYKKLQTNPVLNAMFGFSAAFQKDTSWLLDLLENTDTSDPVQKDVITLAHWLKYSSPKTQWRTEVIKKLAIILRNDKLPQPLRYRAFAGLLSNNDPTVLKFFPKLLEAKSAEQRKFGALGCSFSNTKAIQNLLINSTDDHSDIVSYAAIIGISLMQGNRSHKILHDFILNSNDENTSRTAAEGLSWIIPEGQKILKELVKSENIVTRRSGVFGLAAVQERWSNQLLEDLAQDDSVWIIRTTASRLSETTRNRSYAIPRPLPPYKNAEWLTKYAVSLGKKLSPEFPPIDILLQALINKESDLQWNALNYLRQFHENDVIHATLKCYFNPETSVGTARAADYNLWLYSVTKHE